MNRTAVGWLTWELTQSTSWLGIIALADLLPTVILAIVSGAIADRMGFMRIIRLSQISACLLTALMATLILTGMINIYAVLVITMLFGSAESIGQPARMSAVHALVAKRDLSSAIALGSAAFNASRIIGPSIAGAIILWFGSGVVIALCSLTFLVFFLILQTIRIVDGKDDHKAPTTILHDIGSGVSYAWRNTDIRFLMMMLAATSFFIRPVIELMPGVSAKVFQSGPDGLAFLLASIGAGALCASLWLARRGETRGLTGMLIWSTVGAGAALMTSMLFQSLLAAGFFLAFMGAFMLTGNVSAQTLIQNSVDSGLRARVMSLFIVFAYGLPAIGAVIMGWVAARAGLQITIGSGAGFMLLVWLWARPQQASRAAVLEREQRQA